MVRNRLRRVYHSRLTPNWMRSLRRRIRARHVLLSDIDGPPTTYSQKVRYRMATDRRTILTTFADRIAAREYVRDRAGDSVLTKVYAVTERPETLVPSDLPREFVVKTTHGSGGMIIVGEHVSPDQELPPPPVGWVWLRVHPDRLDWTRLVELCNHWLGLRCNPYKEWAYSRVRPRIVVEELLLADGRIPWDYKFLVFDGKVGLVWVDQDRFGDHQRNLYTPEWKSLHVSYVFPQGPAVPRPHRLDAMIALAEELGRGIDFVRVDLYTIGDRVVFGELTNYPEAGGAAFDPPEFDEEVGALWSQDTRQSRRLRRR